MLVRASISVFGLLVLVFAERKPNILIVVFMSRKNVAMACKMVEHFTGQISLIGGRVRPKSIADDEMKLVEPLYKGIPSLVLEDVAVGRAAS
jgi:hypothetical protein